MYQSSSAVASSIVGGMRQDFTCECGDKAVKFFFRYESTYSSYGNKMAGGMALCKFCSKAFEWTDEGFVLVTRKEFILLSVLRS